MKSIAIDATEYNRMSMTGNAGKGAFCRAHITVDVVSTEDTQS
jgi:hypothetical protein